MAGDVTVVRHNYDNRGPANKLIILRIQHNPQEIPEGLIDATREVIVVYIEVTVKNTTSFIKWRIKDKCLEIGDSSGTNDISISNDTDNHSNELPTSGTTVIRLRPAHLLLSVSRQTQTLSSNRIEKGSNHKLSSLDRNIVVYRYILSLTILSMTPPYPVGHSLAGGDNPSTEPGQVYHIRKRSELPSTTLRKQTKQEHPLVKEENRTAYKKQFSKFIERCITADNLEEMYAIRHAAIRANPVHQPKQAKNYGEQKIFTAK
ncbi:unnamed protein product [Angiostrongylus costaricensis]|uniref:Ribosomal_L18_c domain-containing protein n=1 Tax=Angiostrongylus costaricensis TaxID=334426 RepID=A0A158PHF4_ANGCS|nr:unnamed protein product [Angiostrongylus costaricensis]